MDAIIKIFKYVVYIILLYGVFVISTNLITHAEETRYEIIVDEVNYYDTNDNLQEIKLLNENKILVFENNTYLIKNNNLVKIDNELVDYEIKEEDIYKLFNHKFCINENEFIDEECLFKDFYLDQKYIYLVGTKNSDAVIIKLNYKLEIIKEILLGGEGNEQFVNVNVISNKLYIIGEKDAVSNNSIFKNVGSENTKKVFIIKYDEELEKELYFNFSEEDEFFQQVLYLEDYISILFKNGKIVKFDYKLNLLENKQPFTNTDFISKDINNENEWYFYIFDKMVEHFYDNNLFTLDNEQKDCFADIFSKK